MILTGELAGKRFDVPGGGLRLGRSSSNDVHVPDEELSRNHCLFEQSGMEGIRIVDLASANGTFVNGEQLGADAKDLKTGDVIEAGRTTIKVVEEGAPDPHPQPAAPAAAFGAGQVDLGLDATAKGSELVGDATSGWGKKTLSRANILWGVVVILVSAAIALMILMPQEGQDAPVAPGGMRLATEARLPPAVTELRYEKIDADSTHIFRFMMEVGMDGVLSVTCDDVPGERRHIEKKKQLSKEEKAHIAKIFSDEGWDELDRSYTGSSDMDENRLESWRICAIGGGRIRETLVENTTEPDAFRRVREALEAFSRNELGIWAMQYSREELLGLVQESERLGDVKYGDRDAMHGNLAEAVAAYRQACFYMDTIEPKPEGYKELREKLANAISELDKRYKDQRFAADRAINLSDWETARRELRILLEILPDTEDSRHTEAKAKLVDVEKRLSRKNRKKGGM